MQVSVDKCYVLNLGKLVCDISLNINNNAMPVVPTCRDLGVNVTSDLAPSVHIDHIVKAHQRANNTLRCFVSRDRLSLTKAFVTYVRDHCLNIIVSSGHLI